MACDINIPVTGNIGAHLNKIKEAIEKNGGSFSGDETSGHFQIKIMGTIAGHYQVNGTVLQIIVEQKPLFISCFQIEKFLTDRLKG